jgi:endonuclease/exonuclease/phosphatase family metal-dependent hydrolase
MRALTGAVVAVLLGGLLAATPGQAAERPGRVGPPQVVAAALHTLTLDWEPVAGASGYRVRMADNVRMRRAQVVATPTATRVQARRLRAGKVYCFRVRAVAGDRAGAWSRTVCKPTLATQGRKAGPSYRVLTYNICSALCDHWDARRAPVRDMVRNARPAVAMLQESVGTSGLAAELAPDYVVAAQARGKTILALADRFRVKRTGLIVLNSRSSRWAVWAVLADREHAGRRVLFVNAHLTAGGDNAEVDGHRAEETRTLLRETAAANPKGFPVVHGGDYNTHRSRVYDTPRRIFARAGYADAFDLGRRYLRPQWSSYNAGKARPRLGYPFAEHIDTFWVDPGGTRVARWANAATVVDGRYLSPFPSDHNPILVRIRVN